MTEKVKGTVFNRHPCRTIHRAGYVFPPQEEVPVELDSAGVKVVDMSFWLKFEGEAKLEKIDLIFEDEEEVEDEWLSTDI